MERFNEKIQGVTPKKKSKEKNGTFLDFGKSMFTKSQNFQIFLTALHTDSVRLSISFPIPYRSISF